MIIDVTLEQDKSLDVQFNETLAAIAGKDGLSAYEIAVKNGFVGTEQEWLNSLAASKTEVVDSLTSTDTDKALSANQGKVLNDNKVDKVEGKDLSSVSDISIMGIGGGVIGPVPPVTPIVDWSRIRITKANGTIENVEFYNKDQMEENLNNKANKATTLEGYGITDAYTKTEVDDALSNKADKKTSNGGFRGGSGARAASGGAVGNGASATYGGAVGSGAMTSDGFAGGKNSRTVDTNDNLIDAIQLGTGTNGTPKTFQVYNYPMMDADGNIPSERLVNAPKTEVIDNLTSTDTDKALSANQGKVLNDSKADKTDIPTKVGELENDLGYITEHQSLADYATKEYVDNAIVLPTAKTAITNPITVNTIYDLGVQTDLSITLPSGKIGDFIQFDFVSGSTATTLSVTSTNGFIGYDLNPEVNKIYSLYFDWGVAGYDGITVSYGWRFNYSEYSIRTSHTSGAGE